MHIISLSCFSPSLHVWERLANKCWVSKNNSNHLPFLSVLYFCGYPQNQKHSLLCLVGWASVKSHAPCSVVEEGKEKKRTRALSVYSLSLRGKNRNSSLVYSLFPLVVRSRVRCREGGLAHIPPLSMSVAFLSITAWARERGSRTFFSFRSLGIE